jgi:hypothetical protein
MYANEEEESFTWRPVSTTCIKSGIQLSYRSKYFDLSGRLQTTVERPISPVCTYPCPYTISQRR